MQKLKPALIKGFLEAVIAKTDGDGFGALSSIDDVFDVEAERDGLVLPDSGFYGYAYAGEFAEAMADD